MPTLHSLSIRRRGTTRIDKPTHPSVANTAHTVFTIKRLFHKKTTSNTSKVSTDISIEDAMGNAPSDMAAKTNGNGANGPSKQPTLRSVSDRDSVKSRAMPGAEPPTPNAITQSSTPAPIDGELPLNSDDGYDAANPSPGLESDAGAEGRGLEAGMLASAGTFEVDESGAPQQQPTEDQPASIDPARTPRAELKTELEERLAPLDFVDLHIPSHLAHPRTSEASDATAVSVSPRSPKGTETETPLIWTPGTYVLLNARGGTAMDLHGGNDKMVIGYSMHGGPNQQWEFIPSGHGYVIRCVRQSKVGHALYLTAEGGVRAGAKVVVSPFPVAWSVEQTEDGLRISWPNSNLVFDLSNGGDSKPGTHIKLEEHKLGEMCQVWHYTRCAPAAEPEREKEMSVETRGARGVSPPATTETVTITEERDFITTTRTTTTTAITTVTEVTRTPKSLLRQPQPQRRSIAYR